MNAWLLRKLHFFKVDCYAIFYTHNLKLLKISLERKEKLREGEMKRNCTWNLKWAIMTVSLLRIRRKNLFMAIVNNWCNQNICFENKFNKSFYVELNYWSYGSFFCWRFVALKINGYMNMYAYVSSAITVNHNSLKFCDLICTTFITKLLENEE